MASGRPRDPAPAQHGTRARYAHRSDACKCSRCRKANADYQAAYRAAAQPDKPVQLTIPADAYETIRIGR